MATRRAKSQEKSLDDVVSGLDADLLGIVSVAEWKGTRLEETALRLLPSARSVVVLARAMYPEVMAHATKNKKIGEAPMKDLVESHYTYVNTRLSDAIYEVAEAAHRAGLKALPLPATGLPSDSRILAAVFSFKHAAEAAGMGRIGRSSLLVTPEFGPRVRLACCLTEAELKPTKARKTPSCGDCRLCIEKCPAGALSPSRGKEPYTLNKYACNSFRAGGYCFECIRLCPSGRR